MQSNSNRDRNCCTATQRETRAAWLFLLPSLTGVVLFVLLPFAETVRRSLFDTMGTAWVGLSNYRSVIQNGAFQLAVHNTARFLGICLPILLSGSLVLALVLHSRPLRQTRAARIFKTTFLLPIAIPVASIVLLWQTLFARQGLCNGWLTCLGVQPIDFMGTGTAFWVLTGTYLWKNCGYTSILWTAGLEAIPVDQYEAARVDGAGTWQQFWHITWPELQPTLALTLILSLLNAFKVFREAYLVAGSYPQQSIYLLQHLFNNWFLSLDLPRLAAAAVLVALVLLVVILGLLKWWDHCAKDEEGSQTAPLAMALADTGGAAGMVATLVSLYGRADVPGRIELDNWPGPRAGHRIYRLAPVARLADARTVADPAVGYAAVFCHVLEQHRPVCSSGGREPAGGRACRLGNQPASLSRAQYGSGALHRSDAIALPGNHGAQLSDIAPIWPAGHAVGHHFTGHLFYISGIYHGARL